MPHYRTGSLLSSRVLLVTRGVDINELVVNKAEVCCDASAPKGRLRARKITVFFAMVENWKGGAIRKSGALLAILQAASGTGQVVKLELANARLQFGSGSTLAIESATVRRATDHALR